MRENWVGAVVLDYQGNWIQIGHDLDPAEWWHEQPTRWPKLMEMTDGFVRIEKGRETELLVDWAMMIIALDERQLEFPHW